MLISSVDVLIYQNSKDESDWNTLQLCFIKTKLTFAAEKPRVRLKKNRQLFIAFAKPLKVRCSFSPIYVTKTIFSVLINHICSSRGGLIRVLNQANIHPTISYILNNIGNFFSFSSAMLYKRDRMPEWLHAVHFLSLRHVIHNEVL